MSLISIHTSRSHPTISSRWLSTPHQKLFLSGLLLHRSIVKTLSHVRAWRICLRSAVKNAITDRACCLAHRKGSESDQRNGHTPPGISLHSVNPVPQSRQRSHKEIL